jgi:uncharacterized repeat protein (TIGR01451 family)
LCDAARSTAQKACAWFCLAAAALLVGVSPARALAQASDVDLVLNVADSPDPVPATGIVTYSVAIANNSLVTATGVRYIMNVPANATYNGFTAGSGASCTGMTIGASGPGVVTCTHPNLTFNGSAAFTLQLRLNAQGNMVVVSSVTSTQADSDGSNNSVSSSTTVIAGADVTVSLTAPTTLASGSTFNYVLSASNAGPDAATSVRIQLPLSGGFTQIGSMPSGCSTSSGTVTCNIAGAIASGATVVIGNIPGKITAASGSTVTSTASISLQPGAPPLTPQDPNTANNSAVSHITVTAGSDVRLVKTRSTSAPYFVESGFNFVLTPSYDGDAPTNLTVTDVIPANYTVGAVAASQNGWTCGVNGHTVTCTRAAGGVAGYNQALGVITIPVTIVATGTGVTNTATITAAAPTDPTPANNSANDGGATLQTPSADLWITKVGPSPALAVTNVPFNWTITARNAGPTSFFGRLIVTDSVPANVTVNSYTLNGWACTPAPVSGPAVITCDRTYTSGARLSSGASAPSIVMNASATAPGTVTNVAVLTSADSNTVDPSFANNSVSSTVTVSTDPASADVHLIKTVDSTTVAAGNVLTYTMQVINDGPATANNVTLTDALLTLINNGVGATGQGYVGHTVTVQGVASAVNCSSATNGSFGRTLTCSIPVLPMCTVNVDCPTIQVAIRPGGNGGSRTNSASAISSNTADPATTNNTTQVSNTVDPRADVQVTVAGTPDPTPAGQPLTYVVTARNNGPSQAFNVTVTDVLPLDVYFVSATPSTGTCSVKPTTNSITTVGNRTVTCALGTLALNVQQTVTITVRPRTLLRGLTIHDTASVSTTSIESEPGSANNMATLTTMVGNPSLDLLVNKVESVDPVSVGDQTVYTITVNNTGPSDAENVVVTDTLPAAGLSFQSASTAYGTCSTTPAVDAVGGVVVCTIPRISVAALATVTVTMKGVLKGVYTNRAFVQSDETTAGFDVLPSNNAAVQTTTVRTRADMQVVSKTASSDSVPVRRPYTWTIRLRNNTGVGLAEADTVRVSDNLPTTMELTGTPTVAVVSGSVTSSVCTGTAGQTTFTCTLGTFSSGGEVDITVPVRNLTVPSGNSSTNSVTVTTSSQDVAAQNNSNSGSVTVTSSSISGLVFRDFNNNGTNDVGDTGLNAISMTLSGTAFDGSAVSRTTTTSAGAFTFSNLPEGTYTVQRGTVSEAYLTVGVQCAGSSGGTTITPPNISNITLGANTAAANYRWSLVPQARLGVAKRIIGTPVSNADGSITAVMRIKVQNFSIEAINSVAVSDQLNGVAPRFGTFVAGGAAATLTSATYTIATSPSVVGSCVGGTPALTFDGSTQTQVAAVSTLAIGGSCEFDFTLRYRPTEPLPGGGYTNTALGAGTGALSGQLPTDVSENGANTDPDGDNNPTNNNTPTPMNTVLAADVFTAIALPSPVAAGATAQGTVRFENIAPYTASGVAYTLSLSANLGGVTFGNLPAGASASYNSATGVVTFNGMPASLAGGQIVSGNGTSPITVSYTQNSIANTSITSSISTTTFEGLNAGPNSASVTVTGPLIADVTTVLVLPTSVDAGNTVNGTVRYRNTGPSIASGVTYTLTFTSGLTGVTFGNLPGGSTATYNTGSGAVTFSSMPTTLAVGAIASGNGTSDITFSYTQPGSASSAVSGSIGTTTSQGANVAPDTAAVTLTGGLIADVTTVLSFPALVDAGNAVNGTITYRNNGPSTASGLTYSLTLTSGLSGVSFGNLPGSASASYNATSGVVTLSGMPAALDSGRVASGNGTTPITVTYIQPGSAISTVSTTIGTSTNQGANVALDMASTSPGGGLVADVRALVSFASPVHAGQPVSGTVRYSNGGPSVSTGMTYALSLAPNLAGVAVGNLPSGASASYNASTGAVTFANMPTSLAVDAIASGNGTSGITVSYIQNGTANSTVTATIGTAINQGANIAPDVSTVTVTGQLIVDVSTSLSGFLHTVPPGTLVNGLLWYRNTGPSTASSVTYRVALTPFLSGVVFSNLPSGATTSYNATTGVVTFTGMPSAVPAGTIVSGNGSDAIGIAYLQTNGVRSTVSTVITTATSQGVNALPDSGSVAIEALKPSDLAVVKTTEVTSAAPGDTVTYRIRVTNYGPDATVPGSMLTDRPTAGLTLLSSQCVAGAQNLCATAPSVAQLQTGALLPALPASRYFEIFVQALVTASRGSVVSNSAQVSVPDGYIDQDSTNNISVAGPLPVQASPDVAMTKSVSGPFVAGRMATYLLQVRNVGLVATTGIMTIVDELPVGVTFVRASGDGWSCHINGRSLTCTSPGPLAAGALTTVTLDVTIPESERGSITNSATVFTPDDITPGNNTGTVSTPVVIGPDLRTTKTLDVSTLLLGGTGMYRIVVVNGGSQATTGDVVIRDTLPAGLIPVTANGVNATCIIDVQVVTCRRTASLAVDASQAVNIAVTVSTTLALAPLTNTACAETVGELNTSDNCGAVTVPVGGARHVDLRKTAIGAFTLNRQGTYRLIVRNSGTLPVAGPLTLLDTLPRGLTAISADGVTWPCSVTDNVVRCASAGPLAAGDSSVVVITTLVGPDVERELTNCATLSIENGEGDRACATVIPAVGADLRTVKQSLSDTLRIDGSASYRISITNIGVAATSALVTLTDTLPAGLVPTSASGAGFACTVVGQAVRCLRTEGIAAGSTVVVHVDARVLDVGRASVKNTACTVTVDDLNDDNNCGSVITPVSGRLEAALRIEADGQFTVGGASRFRVWVRNPGAVPLAGTITVTDTLPSGLSFVSATGAHWVCTSANDVVACTTTMPIAAGDSGVISLVTTVVGDVSSPLTNCATLAIAGVTVDGSAGRSCVTVHPTADGELVLDLSTPRHMREMLETPDFTMTVRNVGSSPLPDVVITNQLPPGFAYVRGSTTRADDALRTERRAVADPDGGIGPVVRWPVGDMAPGAVVRISYRAQIRIGAAVSSDNVTTSTATTTLGGAVIASRPAQTAIRIESEAFATRGVISGAVMMQCYCDSLPGFAAGELGIPGVRVLLEDGTGAITDEEGKYNFINVRAGLHVVRIDDTSLPTGARLITLNSRNAGNPWSRLVDLKSGEMFRADFTEGSNAPHVLADVLARRERRNAGVTSDDGRASTGPRPFLAIGVLQGRVSLSNIKEGMVTSRNGFDDALQDMAITRDSGRVNAGARGALLMKGDVGRLGLLTLAFDSERDSARTAFRDITPDRGFAVFGDASVREFDAQSQQRLYFRLDRGASFLRYGDFATPHTDHRRMLLAYDRSMTGLTYHLEGSYGTLNTFASQNRNRQVIDELPGRGLSGPYFLSRALAMVNTERVEIITRDRNQPAVILRRQLKSRFEDYTIEPGTGRLLFRAPVPSLDADFNPVFIRVSYEVEQGGQEYFTYGGEGRLRLGARVELGTFAVRDDNPLDEQQLLGGSTVITLGDSTTLVGEYARTETAVNTLTGSAWRIDLQHQSSRFTGRLFAVQGDSAFHNRSSVFLNGRNEYGARSSITLGSRTRVFGEGMRTEDTRTAGRRDGAMVSLEQRLSHALALEVGYRWASENGASVRPLLPGDASALPGGGMSDVTRGLTPLSFSAARARVSMRMPGSEKSLVFAEYEHGLDSSEVQRGSIGGEYRFAERARLYLRHEWISAHDGPYALASGLQQQNTVLGVNADYVRNSTVYSEYRAHDAFSGRDAEASIGLRNQWTVAPGVRANTSFERVSPLRGTASDEAYAATGAMEWTNSAIWKGTARLEWRTSPAGDNLLGSLGYARKLSRDWSLLGRSTWDQRSGEAVRGRTQFGVAWRETEWNRVNALFRVENRMDQTDALGATTTRSLSNMAAALVNVQLTPRVTLSTRYAGKMADDRYDDVSTRSKAHLVMGRTIFDINSRLDLGVIGSVFGNGVFTKRQYGAGAELGVVVFTNLRLAGGYNVFGFVDRDFESYGHLQRGPYLEFGLKFDEGLLGIQRKPGMPIQPR